MKTLPFSTLHIALGASLALHGVLLTVRLVDPQAFSRVLEDSPLEVILVNARTKEKIDKNDKPKAIAQTTLAGGGEAEQGRASSPLPPALVNDAGDAMEMVKASHLQTLQEQQSLLLADVKNQLAQLANPDPLHAMLPSELQQQEEKRRQLSKLLAEVEQRINSENARPKKRYISPSTQAKAYAVYYDSLRQRIEDRGTANFPSVSGIKLYGELTMIVTINHDGQVLQTEVVQGSGSPLLDRRAEAIARTAGPFGPFTPAMRKEADQLLVVSRFRFTRDNTLEAQVNAAP